MKALRTASNKWIYYNYDELERMDTATVKNTSGEELFKTTYAFWNKGGEQTSMQVEYREMVGYFPNSDGTQSVEGLITGVKYAYDSVGNIIAIYESRPQGSYQYRRKLAEYTYDTQNQLLSETYYTYSQDGPHHFTAVTWNYAYDTAGNILSQYKTTASRAGSDQPIVKTEATEEKTYTYGNSTWQDLLTAVDDSPIVYEGQTYHNGTVSGAVESGNPIRYTNGVKTYTDLTWEHGRQLASITTGNKTYTYDYDATGIRTEKVVDGVVHSYVTQNGRVVQESFPYGNTTVIMIFSYDEQGKPFSLQYSYNGGASFAQYYYATNAQGDVEGIFFTRKNATTGKQEIHWMGYYTYDGWGNILSIIDADGYIPSNPANLMNRNPLRYRGYYYDSETGFYYLRSRYYDPANHRFINADSPEYATMSAYSLGDSNLFSYCGNNPVTRHDESGCSWISSLCAVVATVAVVVAATAICVAVAAVAAPAVVTVGGLLVSTAPIVTAATTVAIEATTVATCAIATAAASDYIENCAKDTYSVYFLEDTNGRIQYVGRVKDKGYHARMRYHESTRGLTPAYRVSGLSYAEARGLEEIGMVECHTLNALNPQNNQIHGIGPNNKNGGRYMDAAINYLSNRAENTILALLS